MKNFILGITSGILITIITAFALHPSISITKLDSSSYIDINQPIPHYEFSTNDTPYIEYLDIRYKISPPFYSFDFNSHGSIPFPEGYFLIQKIPENSDECITWDQKTNNELIIYTKQNQFKFPECSAALKFAKNYKKNELLEIYFNVSWRKDWDTDQFYEEEGIGLYNKLNKPVRNYIFIYNQNESSQIKKNFSECKKIKVFLDQMDYRFRYNLFQNSSIIAVKMDLNPNEVKDLIIRCYE